MSQITSAGPSNNTNNSRTAELYASYDDSTHYHAPSEQDEPMDGVVREGRFGSLTTEERVKIDFKNAALVAATNYSKVLFDKYNAAIAMGVKANSTPPVGTFGTWNFKGVSLDEKTQQELVTEWHEKLCKAIAEQKTLAATDASVKLAKLPSEFEAEMQKKATAITRDTDVGNLLAAQIPIYKKILEERILRMKADYALATKEKKKVTTPPKQKNKGKGSAKKNPNKGKKVPKPSKNLLNKKPQGAKRTSNQNGPKSSTKSSKVKQTRSKKPKSKRL